MKAPEERSLPMKGVVEGRVFLPTSAVETLISLARTLQA